MDDQSKKPARVRHRKRMVQNSQTESRENTISALPRQEKVGYKNPPKSNQFKSGKSGNPRGRPKKRNKTLEEALYEFGDSMIMISTSEGKKQVTGWDAFVQSTWKHALNGNIKMCNLLTEIRRRKDEEMAKKHRPQTGAEFLHGMAYNLLRAFPDVNQQNYPEINPEDFRDDEELF